MMFSVMMVLASVSITLNRSILNIVEIKNPTTTVIKKQLKVSLNDINPPILFLYFSVEKTPNPVIAITFTIPIHELVNKLISIE
jgi:hypothetical protein